MYGSTVGKFVLTLSTPITVMSVIVPSVLSLQVAPESVYTSSCSNSTCAKPRRVITGGMISGGGDGLGGGGSGGGIMRGGGDGGAREQPRLWSAANALVHDASKKATQGMEPPVPGI